MRKLFTFLFFALLAAGCFEHDIVWGIHNRSDHDIYFIMDFKPEDNVISVGSDCKRVKSHTIGELSSKAIRHMKDSLHMYIIDGEVVDIGPGRYLSEDQVALIDEDAILDRVTRTPQSKTFGYVYPPETDK